MIKYKVPASSANLGIGFDCMGVALDLYNSFEVEYSDDWQFEGFEEKYANEDNLFIKAYKKAIAYKNYELKKLKIKIESNIPVCRGLGSSSCLSVAGIYAFSALNNNCLSKKEMLELATELEGHPDNVAPTIYGGLCVMHNGELLKVDIDERYKFGLWIPNKEVSTKMAREVLPLSYKLEDVVNNVSASLFVIEALRSFDTKNISFIMDDKIHEPYRCKLIDNFDQVKDYAMNNGALAFIISGSGSTCLSISDKVLDVDNVYGFEYMNVLINREGVING